MLAKIVSLKAQDPENSHLMPTVMQLPRASSTNIACAVSAIQLGLANQSGAHPVAEGAGEEAVKGIRR